MKKGKLQLILLRTICACVPFSKVCMKILLSKKMKQHLKGTKHSGVVIKTLGLWLVIEVMMHLYIENHQCERTF